MELEKSIENRRTHYTTSYSGDKVAQEQIERMLEMANWAPTHKYTEPWRFNIYEGRKMDNLLDLIADLYVRNTTVQEYKQDKIQVIQDRKKQVSHLLVISMQRSELVPEFEEISAVAMAVQNMWLYLAQFDDIGAYWSTPKEVFTKEFHEHVGLVPNERVLGLFYIGKLKEGESAIGKRGDWKEKVKWHKN